MINVMHLNHPQTIPLLPTQGEETVFRKTGPWGQKDWGLLD